MLSKYYHLKENSKDVVKVDMDVFISALISNLKEKHRRVSIQKTYPGGTLGVFFQLLIDGKKKFVKTHRYGDIYRDNLLKEIEVMSLIYKDIVEIERIDIIRDGMQFTFMIMDYLISAESNISVAQVRTCIDYYQQRLKGNKLSVKYSFEDVIKAGKQSLENLYEEGFFVSSVYEQCKESLSRIIACSHSLNSIICHGDLSNVNIMYNESRQPIVIDWEDSLKAFPEYDFLYWMTFFSQRKYYAYDLFEKCHIDKIWGIDIMILITIIKSGMSYQNGSYRNNSISFQDRIQEIYNILK